MMRSTLIALLLPLVAVLGGETECVLFHCASELAQCEIGKKLPQQPRALEVSSVPLTTLLHNAAVPNLRTHVTDPRFLSHTTHTDTICRTWSNCNTKCISAKGGLPCQVRALCCATGQWYRDVVSLGYEGV